MASRKFLIAPREHFVLPVRGTYPRLCRLPDGSILAGYTAFGADGERILSIARSLDDGRTFQAHGEVARSRGDTDNIFLLQLPTPSEGGTPTILAAFRNHDLDPVTGGPTYFRITVCKSTDGGRTWSFLSQAFEKPAPNGLWEPFMRVAKNGRDVQLYFSQEIDKLDQETMLVRSSDGGKTWSSPPVRLTGAGERFRDGMVGVAETTGLTNANCKDALVMVMETTRRGPDMYSVEAVLSCDDGATFGARQVVYEPRPGRNAGAPQVASFADGSVAVVFMTDEDRVEESIWPGGAKIKVVFSGPPEDGVFRWSAPEVVGEDASSWPGVMRMADSAVLAVYEFSSAIRGKMLSVTGGPY
jgi:hypothetical protein